MWQPGIGSQRAFWVGQAAFSLGGLGGENNFDADIESSRNQGRNGAVNRPGDAAHLEPDHVITTQSGQRASFTLPTGSTRVIGESDRTHVTPTATRTARLDITSPGTLIPDEGAASRSIRTAADDAVNILRHLR